MVCRGNGTEFCGAGSRLNLYSATNSTDPPTSTTGAATATATPTGPAIVMNAANFLYQWCATEVPGRALNGKAVAADDMNIDRCAGNCTGFAYMGVEYGRGMSAWKCRLILC
jgi:hypothetical protein